jgi:hypothetical protein
VKNYHLWQREPRHPSLRFRRLQGSTDRFSVRIGALGKLSNETLVWVWIGTHSEYDQMVGC